MSDFTPTASQSAAMHTRGSTILVSAGAGSGKTKVLTERLMSYITDPVSPADIDSFVIITYTRAAAGELRGRISEELAALLAADPGNRRLRRQNALCQRAVIGTIHSFCSGILRENCHLLGLSPDFRVVEEDRAASMRASALERVMDEHYAHPDRYPGFTLLADTVGAGRDDSRLTALVQTLYDKMQCHARPEKWAEQQTELLSRCEGLDASQTPWGAEILDYVRGLAEYWAAELARLTELMTAEAKISAAYGPSVSAACENIRALCRGAEEGWDEARRALPVEFPKLGTLRNSPCPELSEKVKARLKACKAAMANIEKSLSDDSSRLMARLSASAPAMSALLELTLDLSSEYAADKRRAGLVDYSDLEHFTAGLLTEEDGTPTELARNISRRYTEIMVDEYQDVNEVQDAIFRAVSREGKNLFMVGDVKQSIYRFRLADPGIFTEKYLSYAEDADAAPGEPRRILLQENFRSRKEILDAANTVFSLCMSRRLGELDYDEAAALKCGASYEGEGCIPELMLLHLPTADSDEEAPDKTSLEAEMAARKMRELVESGTMISDHGTMRPVEYGDMAVLLRSANSIGPIYRRVLSQNGIPVASGQGGSFFDAEEISVMMSVLSVIDNPHQDIPLIAVLRSPALGFTADELSAVRAKDKKADFYTALTLAAETDEKCRRFLSLLSELRGIAADMAVGELVWTVCDRLDMPAICSAMADGEQRRANLFELVELSERFEGTGYRGLHRFVLWLRRLAEKGQEPDVGQAAVSAVQILSIHRSKGLEYPVVFLCDLAKSFNLTDTGDTVLIHPELGLGPKFVDTERRIEFPTLARSAIKRRLERETLSEEMRVLYVAMTRPKERLYMTAAFKDPAKTIETAAAAVTVPMAPEVIASARNPAMWLIYAALADGERHIKMKICLHEDESAEQSGMIEGPEPDESAVIELYRRLSYVYPHASATKLPSKVTATELKGREETDGDAESVAPQRQRSFRMPDFTRLDKPVTGAERGTATHLVLQYMDFGKTGDMEAINSEIQRLRELDFLSEREAQAVDASAIQRLFASGIGKRILSADKLMREFKFSLLCDAGQVFGEAEGEEVLLQGVVDCCLEEQGELVIVDYKTDAVRTDSEIRERSRVYEGQLRAYAGALERIYRKRVKECVLYFLTAGREVRVRTD